VTLPSSGYPLASLEALRRRLLDSARGDLAVALAEAARARDEAEGAADALRGATDARSAAERDGEAGSALELHARERWIACLRDREQRLRDACAARWEEERRATAEEGRRRDRVIEAERSLRTVERHRGLWERARRHAALEAQEAEAEDRTLATYGRPPGPAARR